MLPLMFRATPATAHNRQRLISYQIIALYSCQPTVQRVDRTAAMRRLLDGYPSRNVVDDDACRPDDDDGGVEVRLEKFNISEDQYGASPISSYLAKSAWLSPVYFAP